MRYAIRYTPGTDLAARWPEPSSSFATRSAAEAVRHQCANGDRMEVVEVELTTAREHLHDTTPATAPDTEAASGGGSEEDA